MYLGRSADWQSAVSRAGSPPALLLARPARAGRMFCAAARGLANCVDQALGQFYRRVRGRIGGLAAHVALAHKLALLFYRLLRYDLTYVEQGLKAYAARVLETETRLLQKLAKKQGFTLISTASA